MKMNGKVIALFICPVVGGQMESVQTVKAIPGKRFKGDHYSIDSGPGPEQHVTLINGLFFQGSGFEFADSYRNIVTEGIELMPLIRRDIRIGNVVLRGIKYCGLPDEASVTSRKGKSFQGSFSDRGGLIAVVVKGGTIRVGDPIH